MVLAAADNFGHVLLLLFRVLFSLQFLPLVLNFIQFYDFVPTVACYFI